MARRIASYRLSENPIPPKIVHFARDGETNSDLLGSVTIPSDAPLQVDQALLVSRFRVQIQRVTSQNLQDAPSNQPSRDPDLFEVWGIE